ncbi:MAG: hypothetical protein SVO01_03790 [Thermotogota bacterium]|nr:hypothetical protein [Thermotogota bacterium]
MKPEETRYRATTQVKVLSPEILIMSEVDAVYGAEDSSLTGDKRGSEEPTGSEAVARYQRDKLGTRETRNVPGERVWAAKPIDGKVVQMTLWESDQCIVPKKPRNGGGGKALAAVPWDERDTFSAHRGGQRKSTKLSSLTALARVNPQMRFTSLAHLLTVDFLKECFEELKKDKAPGVDGVTVKEYEVTLEKNLKELVEKLRAKRYKPQPVRRIDSLTADEDIYPKVQGRKKTAGHPHSGR